MGSSKPTSNTGFLFLIIAIVVATVSACSSNATIESTANKNLLTQPSWVFQPPVQHGYAYGVGSAGIVGDAARAVTEAQNNALQDLIGKMQVSVSGSIQITTRVDNSKISKLIEDEVKSSIPEVKLANAVFVKRFVDDKNQYLYVLAELDRNRAAFEISSQLSEIELSLLPYIQLPITASRLRQWHALQPALPLIEQYKQLSRQLQIVSLQNQGHDSNDTISTLEKTVRDLLDSLIITLSAKNPGAVAALPTVTKALTELGFRVSKSEQADLVIGLTITLETKRADSAHYSFASGRATIADSNGPVLNEYVERVRRISGVSQGMAEGKAVEALGDNLGKALGRTLLK